MGAETVGRTCPQRLHRRLRTFIRPIRTKMNESSSVAASESGLQGQSFGDLLPTGRQDGCTKGSPRLAAAARFRLVGGAIVVRASGLRAGGLVPATPTQTEIRPNQAKIKIDSRVGMALREGGRAAAVCSMPTGAREKGSPALRSPRFPSSASACAPFPHPKIRVDPTKSDQNRIITPHRHRGTGFCRAPAPTGGHLESPHRYALILHRFEVDPTKSQKSDQIRPLPDSLRSSDRAR